MTPEELAELNDDEKACLTVAQLISELAAMPPDSYVRTEGCDCYGYVARVIVEDDGVYLMRPPYGDKGP